MNTLKSYSLLTFANYVGILFRNKKIEAMKRKSFFYLLVSFVTLGFLLSGCQKQEATELGVSFETVTTPFNLGAKKITTGQMQFTSGTIRLQEIKFKAESDDDSLETEFKTNGLVTVDFATGQTIPSLDYIQIPAGTYKKIKVKLKLADDGVNPSLDLSGIYVSPQGDTIPVRFIYTDDNGYEVELDSNMTFDESQSFMTFVTIDPSPWFANVTDDMMAQATRDSSGVIVISQNQNKDIYEQVSDDFKLARKMECHEHRNENGDDTDHDQDNDHDSDN